MLGIETLDQFLVLGMDKFLRATVVKRMKHRRASCDRICDRTSV